MNKVKQLLTEYKERIEERKEKVNQWGAKQIKQDQENYVVDPNLVETIYYISQVSEELSEILTVIEELEKRVKKLEKKLDINKIYD